MHVTQVLNNQLFAMCQGIHKKRLHSLMRCVRALMIGKTLTVTGLGRAMQSPSTQKHNIKSADRLIGNPSLHHERQHLYEAQAKCLIGRTRQPVILIDWSDLTEDRHFHMLRASTPVGGRAMTLYEEVHPQPYVNNRGVHRRFLKKLKRLLPDSCCPIVITDAGFKSPWFRAVERLGWDWVGRISKHTHVRKIAPSGWMSIRSLYNRATVRPRYFGHVMLTRKTPLNCHCYLWHRQAKGRIKKNRLGIKTASSHSLKNAKREKSPWVLATSLTGGGAITKQIIRLYQSRMQIEEAFRDTKNPQWGYALRHSRTTMTYRFENLLLINTLATLATWLIGKVAEGRQWHRRYQANTIKTRSVLSTFYLGGEVLKQHASTFSRKEYQRALWSLRNIVQQGVMTC